MKNKKNFHLKRLHSIVTIIIAGSLIGVIYFSAHGLLGFSPRITSKQVWQGLLQQASPTATNQANLSNVKNSYLPIIVSEQNVEPPKEGYQVYKEPKLGFAIQYPVNWFELDTSKLTDIKRKCFGPNPGESTLNYPQFCVEFEPSVQIPGTDYYRNSSKAQQEFFSYLLSDEAMHASTKSGVINQVTQKLQVAGLLAVEQVEAYTPEAEGTENTYTVNVYVNHPKKGLIRLFMVNVNYEQFEKYKSILNEMLNTFVITN